MSGSVVRKTTLDQTGQEKYLKNGHFRTSSCPRLVKFWYQLVFFYTATAGLIKYILSPATERSNEPAPGIWLETDPITQNQNKKRDNNRASDDRLRDLPEWLEEFTDNREDTEMFASAHTHFSGLRFGTSFESGINIKGVYFSHFPKDRNCEVCLRSKITRAPCRRRAGEAVLRAEMFGDLMTADHKVLREGCESRNNHWYAVVVHATGNCNRGGIPECLEDFTENLEIAEVLVPAGISHDSDPERPRKVASRKHSILTHFPKDPKL